MNDESMCHFSLEFVNLLLQKRFVVCLLVVFVQAFMLKRTTEETLGHAAGIVADVLEHAETDQVINASQKRTLLHHMALRLS